MGTRFWRVWGGGYGRASSLSATDSTMMTSRRGSIVATIFLFSILLSTVPQDACAFGGFSGGWGGGSSSNRLTISGPGYSRTVGKDGSVKQSFEQTTTGKSKRSSGSVGFNIGFGGGSPGGSSSSGGGCPSNPGILASIAGCAMGRCC